MKVGITFRSRPWAIALAVACCAFAINHEARAQDTVNVTVRTLAERQTVKGALVSSGRVTAITDDAGEATLRLPVGARSIHVERIGVTPKTITFILRTDTVLVIELETEAVEEEAIIVTSTRTERRIEDEPIRVEVIGREEIEEKLLMTPGDIAMLLNETAGLRVQPTAPSLGGASVRIQGLLGRYTQVLADGLPLYGGQTGALGPLQIPPMDLGRVEVIKGVASALYGASALGGVVNLISRKSGSEPQTEILLNQSTLGGTDAIGWHAQPINQHWGYSLIGSGHRQARADVDDDGWADVAGFERVMLRPRLYWNNDRGGNALLTVGAMLEDRSGGTLSGSTTPAGLTVREGLKTKRADAGAVIRLLSSGSKIIGIRSSASAQSHKHDFAGVIEDDVHTTAFFEASLAGTAGNHTYVIGAAVQRDGYAAESVDDVDYTFTVPGLFAQDEYVVGDGVTLSASGRVDHHSRYGTFFNPRISALLRPRGEWSIRAALATGFFGPTPWIDETEAVGLSRLTGFGSVQAERARSASIDVGRTIGPFELNATVFASRIRNAVQVRAIDGGGLQIFNAATQVRTHGTEFLARYHRHGMHVTATHVYMRSTEPDPDAGDRRDVPLTPRHTASVVAALEQEDRGRFGVEFYYTGRQHLNENPYRTTSTPHVIVGFLVERHFGRLRAFLNAENVFDTRQTRYDPLVLPSRSAEGRWTTDVWAPLEGRSFNAGARIAI